MHRLIWPHETNFLVPRVSLCISVHFSPFVFPLSHTDCTVICTCSVRSTLPDDFVAASRTAHLSRIATAATSHLPKQTWMVDSYCDKPSSFGGLLQLNLAHLPKSLISRTDHLTGKQFPVLFNLVVIHSLVAFQPKRGNELAPVHYSNLITSIGRLVSVVAKKLDIPIILHFLLELVRDLYSNCIEKEQMQSLAEGTLTVDHCAPGTNFSPLPGVELAVPTTTSLEKFAEHVERTIKTASEKHM